MPACHRRSSPLTTTTSSSSASSLNTSSGLGSVAPAPYTATKSSPPGQVVRGGEVTSATCTGAKPAPGASEPQRCTVRRCRCPKGGSATGDLQALCAGLEVLGCLPPVSVGARSEARHLWWASYQPLRQQPPTPRLAPPPAAPEPWHSCPPPRRAAAGAPRAASRLGGQRRRRRARASRGRRAPPAAPAHGHVAGAAATLAHGGLGALPSASRATCCVAMREFPAPVQGSYAAARPLAWRVSRSETQGPLPAPPAHTVMAGFTRPAKRQNLCEVSCSGLAPTRRALHSITKMRRLPAERPPAALAPARTHLPPPASTPPPPLPRRRCW